MSPRNSQADVAQRILIMYADQAEGDEVSQPEAEGSQQERKKGNFPGEDKRTPLSLKNVQNYRRFYK